MEPIEPQAPRAPIRLALIDGVRGYLLAAMFIAHLCVELQELGQRPWLSAIRHAEYLPIGEVEFFLFLSGFVAALAYQPAFDRGGIGGAGRAVLRRIGWLYFYQVAATVALVVLVRGAGLTGVDLRNAGGGAAPTAALLRQALTLVVMPENLDILMLYIVMMPAMPWVLAWLGEGRAWRLYLLLALAWGLAALGLDVRLAGWLAARGLDWSGWFALAGHFNPLSFAVLFYGGFAIGHRWRRDGPAAVARLAPAHPALAATALALVIIYVALRLAGSELVPGPNDNNERLTSHALLVTIAILYLGHWLLATPHNAVAIAGLARLLRRLLGWRFFGFLGRNSLFVYAIHVVIVALAKHFAMAGGLHTSQLASLGLCVAGLAVIGGLTWLKRRWLPMAG